MKIPLLKSKKGVALTVVMIVLYLLSLLIAYALYWNINQKKLTATIATGKRVKIYYAAQAGAVDAISRIRTDINFQNSLYSTTYNLSINQANDVQVTIGSVGSGGAGLRKIDSTGLDI